MGKLGGSLGVGGKGSFEGEEIGAKGRTREGEGEEGRGCLGGEGMSELWGKGLE